MIAWRPLLGMLGWEFGLYLLSLWYLNFMAWGPREVIWSLWATSLLVGGITLLLSILRKAFCWVGPALRGDVRNEKFADVEVRPWHIALLVFGSTVGAAFFIGFFTVHFGMFHAGHSIFLNGFFPLVENQAAPGDLPRILIENFRACLDAFPVFIGVCVAASVPGWLRGDHLDAPLTAPYATVIKLHITIIAIGFADAAGQQAAALIVFLAVYFLPLRAVFDAAREATGRAENEHDSRTTTNGESNG